MQDSYNEDNDTAPETNEELANDLWCKLKRARDHISKWRQETREAYKYYAGDQWNSDDKQVLEDQQRPCVTFNRIPRVINAVAGLELQNRQEVRYLPRKVGQEPDGPVSDMLTGAAKWARDLCDAEDEESEMFQDACICGMGWTESRMDYEEDSQGLYKKERIDPIEMLWDTESKRRNLSDAKWVAHIKDISKKEVKELWPNFKSELSNFWEYTPSDDHNADQAFEYKNDQSENLSKPNTYSIARIQWWERERYYKVQDPMEGKMIDLSEERYTTLKPMLDQMGAKAVKLTRMRYKQAFMCGKYLLEEPTDLNCNHFTYQCVTGLRDHKNNYWFGMVRMMKDPQMWANKWLSQIQHIINSNAKGGLMAEVGAFVSQSKAEEDYAKPNSIVWLQDGALAAGKVQTKDAPRYPDGVDRLLQYAVSAINDVVGVSMEMMGSTDRNQPAYLEELRKTASISVLATFFSALRYYRKREGRVLAYFIQNYLSDGRLVRIVGEEGAQYIPLVKDKTTFEYDIIVDDAPSSPNMKQKSFEALQVIVPLALQTGMPIPPDVLDYTPLPESLIMKWKKMIAEGSQDPIADQMKQIQMMLAYLETEKTQAEIQKIGSETSKNYAQAEQAHAIGQDESAQAMQKMGLANQEHQLKQEAMMKEQQRKDIEMYLNQRRKMLETQMNAKIKAQQASQPRAQ